MNLDQSLLLHDLHILELKFHILHHFLLVRNHVTEFLVPMFFTPLHLKGYRILSVCYIFISLL